MFQIETRSKHELNFVCKQVCNHVTTFERPLLACKNISYCFRMQKVSFKGETNAKARKCNLQSHLGREGANSVMIAKDKQKTGNYFPTRVQEASKVAHLVANSIDSSAAAFKELLFLRIVLHNRSSPKIFGLICPGNIN